MTNDLLLPDPDRPLTSSTVVADKFGKLHKNVLQAIRNLDVPSEWHELNFKPTFTPVLGPNGASRDEPAFNMTRDGFMILVMGFTGKPAMTWKLKFIEAFNAMESKLALLDDRRKPVPLGTHGSYRLYSYKGEPALPVALVNELFGTNYVPDIILDPVPTLPGHSPLKRFRKIIPEDHPIIATLAKMYPQHHPFRRRLP